MASIPFLRFKDEDEATSNGALVAGVLITIGLATISLFGVWAQPGAASGKVWMSFWVVGLEVLSAFALIRTIAAHGKWKKIVGGGIFFVLACVCVYNADTGVRHIYPEKFENGATELRALATLRGDEAEAAQSQITALGSSSQDELKLARDRIAALEVERKQMTAMTPEGIMEAQNTMISRGCYNGKVDGVRAGLTESAMRLCGEKIGNEIDTLKARESALLTGVANPLQSSASTSQVERISLEADAREAFWAGLFLLLALIVSEAARGAGFWAFSSRQRGSEIGALADMDHKIAMARKQAELHAIAVNPPAEPVQEREAPAAPETPDEPEPAPEPQPEPIAAMVPEPDPVNQGARKGGKNAGHNRKAAKLENLIVVGDWLERDSVSQLQAAE